jgi:hypothetical protein
MIIIIYYAEIGEEKHLVNLHNKSGAVATAKRLVDLRVRSQGGSRAPVPWLERGTCGLANAVGYEPRMSVEIVACQGEPHRERAIGISSFCSPLQYEGGLGFFSVEPS